MCPTSGAQVNVMCSAGIGYPGHKPARLQGLQQSSTGRLICCKYRAVTGNGVLAVGSESRHFVVRPHGRPHAILSSSRKFNSSRMFRCTHLLQIIFKLCLSETSILALGVLQLQNAHCQCLSSVLLCIDGLHRILRHNLSQLFLQTEAISAWQDCCFAAMVSTASCSHSRAAMHPTPAWKIRQLMLMQWPPQPERLEHMQLLLFSVCCRQTQE